MVYNVVLDGKSAGPFEVAALTEMAAAGKLARDTLVWTAGMADWVAAGSVKEFAGMFPPPVPAALQPQNSEAARYAEFKAGNALAMLDAQLQKNEAARYAEFKVGGGALPPALSAEEALRMLDAQLEKGQHPKPIATESEKKEAAKLFKQGEKFYKKGKLVEAIAALRKAIRLDNNSKYLELLEQSSRDLTDQGLRLGLSIEQMHAILEEQPEK
jgi:tetratricopeptide (TPR) repeat protein